MVAWMSRNPLLEIGAISEIQMTETGLEPTTISFANENSIIWSNWPNNWVLLWVLICTVHLTVWSYHVTYTFQIKSTLYGCLNIKELPAWKRHDIWNLIDCNGTQTHNHLVCKRRLNHLPKLTKWLSCVVSTYMYSAFHCMFLSSQYSFQSESTLYGCLNVQELLT